MGGWIKWDGSLGRAVSTAVTTLGLLEGQLFITGLLVQIPKLTVLAHLPFLLFEPRQDMYIIGNHQVLDSVARLFSVPNTTGPGRGYMPKVSIDMRLGIAFIGPDHRAGC
jgi:hypothetical protein